MKEKKQISLISIKGAFSSFYQEEFQYFVKLQRRPFILAILMLIIYNLEIASMVFTNEQEDAFNKYDKLMLGIKQVVIQFKGWTIIENIFSSESLLEYTLIAQIFINSFLLITLIVGTVVFSLKIDKKKFSNFHSVQILKSITSFLFGIYPFILHMPFQHTNLKMLFQTPSSNIYQILGVVNIPLTLGIGWIGIEHDYTYEYMNLDILSRKEGNGFIICFLEESIMCLISESNAEWSYIAFGILIHFRICYCLFYDCYYDKLCSKINFSLILSTWALWLSCAIFQQSFSQPSMNVSFLVISLIPIQIIISNYLIEKRESFLQKIGLTSDISDLKDYQIEKYCRFLFKLMELDGFEYIRNCKGINFESAFCSHTQQCKSKSCFCNQYTYENIQINDNQVKNRNNKNQSLNQEQAHNIYAKKNGPIKLDDKEERFIFLGFLIQNIYKQYFQSCIQDFRNVNGQQLSYLNFLIQVMKIPTKSFVELIESIHKIESLKGNLKSIMKIKQLIKKAEIEFGRFWEKSEIQNQRLNMMSVIDFSDLEISVTKDIKQSLILKKEFLIYLNNEFVDLNKLNLKGKKYLTLRDQLKKDIQNLFDINPFQKSPYSFAEIYAENFDIKKKSANFYSKRSKQKLLQQLKEEDIGINLFPKRSCMVYISLLHPIGIIKRASSSVEQIYGQKIEEVVGKSCNFMMPDAIANIHDDCLNLFVEKGNLHNLKKGIIFGFGKYKNGFMFAVHARTKLIQENLVDFGVVGMFEEINTNYHYFLTSAEGAIIDTTEKIFKLCFSDLWKEEKKKIEGLDICKIIPFIGYSIHFEKKRQIDYNSMLMCIPTTSSMMGSFRKEEVVDIQNLMTKVFNKCKSLSQFQFFEVVAKYEQIDTAVDVSVKFIEFIKIKRLKKEGEVIDHLIELKNKIEKQLDKKLEVNFITNRNSPNITSIAMNQISQIRYQSDLQVKIDQGDYESTNRQGYQDANTFQEIDLDQQNTQLQTHNLLSTQNLNPLVRGTYTQTKDGIFEEDVEQFKLISTVNNDAIQTHNTIQATKKNITKTDIYSETAELNQKLFDQILKKGEVQVPFQDKRSKYKEESILLFQDPSHISQRQQTIQNLIIYFVYLRLDTRHKITSQTSRMELLESPSSNAKIPYDLNIFIPEKNKISLDKNRKKVFDGKISSKDFLSETKISENTEINKNDKTSIRIGDQVDRNKLSLHNHKSQIGSEGSKLSHQPSLSKNLKQLFLQHQLNSQQFSSLNQEGFDDFDEYGEETQSFQNTQQKSKKHQKMTVQIAQSSMGSSGSDLHKKKLILIKVIMDKSIPNVAKFFIQLGYFSGLLLLIVSIIQFIITQQQASLLLSNQQSQESIPVFVNDFAKIIMNTELVRFFTAEINPTDWEELAEEDLLNVSRKHLGEFKEELSSYLLQSADISGISYLETATMKFIESSYQLGPYEVKKSVIQGIQIFFWYLYYYTSDANDNFEIQAPPNQNFSQILVEIYYFYTNTHSDTLAELTNSTNKLFSVFIALLLLSFVSVVLVLPVQFNIQSEKEEILQLICTYPPEKLAIYLQLNENAIQDFQKHHIENNIKASGVSSSGKPIKRIVKISKQNEFLLKGKKKTITETSKLRKISIGTLLLILFILLFLIFQPTFVYALDTVYVQKFVDSIDTLFIIGNSGVSLSSHFSTLFTILNVRRFKEDSNFYSYFQSNFYETLLKSYHHILENSKEINLKLQSLQQRIQDNTSLSQSDRESFLQVAESNMCTEIPLYLNNLKGSLDETYPGFTACTVPQYNEVLKTGLILSFHELFRLFEITLPLLDEQNFIKFEQSFKDFNQQYSFVQMRRVFDNLDAAINVVSSIFSTEIKNNTKTLSGNIQGLFILQLFILFSVFALLWSGITTFSRRNFFQIKYMLTIFSIDQILENTYLSNYLAKHYKIRKDL